MSVEFWNSFFQWGSVALVAVTFVLGAGALWTGNRINERQTARLLVLEADLAKAKTQLSEQQERTATAEQKVLLLAAIAEADRGHARIAPEGDLRQFANLQREYLKAKLDEAGITVGSVAIMHDTNAKQFASVFAEFFRNIGWTVSDQEAVGIPKHSSR